MSAHKLDLVHLAIRSGIFGHIQWNPSAERLVDNDSLLLGIGLSAVQIRLLLHEFVLKGNALDARAETRQEYLQEDPDNPYWYRAVIPFAGLPLGLFVELKIVDDDPIEPWVEIVSAHRQER